ncbi:gliding motility-associated protein GldE [Alkalitalea saponilacus]|uniref:Gliding motility-associated protein GldE n=1 Tax=Alkalitalea saponilacus TaxID=889453 RepID=A0A1T5ASH4_9BACT|nr:gliding motility-associated protein GldE [Alkalitalea saponilacus]SKB38001.1 gliding motility-associated protein GldE [Alkalitalea saponilacus]
MEADSLIQIQSALMFLQFQAFTPGLLLSIIIILLLLLSSALISGSEVAYFSLKPTDLSEMREGESRAGKRAVKHLENPELLLATILISNNFVNVSIVILTAYIVGELVVFTTPGAWQFIIEVVFITGMILLFGEILPKLYAGLYSRKFSAFMAYPLLVLSRFFKPVSILMVKSTNVVNRRLAKKIKGISLDDISHALELTDDNITEGKDILKGIVSFGNINVEEIMTARVDVVDLDLKSEFSKVISVIVESGYSRIPVYDDGPDDVKGILYVKDLLPHLGKDNSFKWQGLIRQAYYVPDTKRINDLLQEFKTHKIHMAIVVDEYGGTSGIVTLEDILEEIVGEISDEMDEDEINFTIMQDGSYVFEGKTLLKDFFKATGLVEDAFRDVSGEAETLAGLLLEIKGEIPLKHEVVEYPPYKFTIMAADNRRIKKIRYLPENKG